MPPMLDASLDLMARREFGQAEALLIWTWRRMALGHARCPLIDREFRGLFGEDAGEVRAAFAAFLDALAYAGRRKLSVGFPGCAGLMPDEWRILTLMASAQNDRPALFEAHLSWLARAEDRHILAIGVSALARAFLAHGLCLAPPMTSRPAPRGSRVAVVGLATSRPAPAMNL